MNRNPTDANKGMDTRKYLEMVGAAVIAILVAILLFVWVSRGKILGSVDHPKPTHSASPQ